MRPNCSCGKQVEISFKKKDGSIVYKKTCRTCRGRVENIERKREISKQYYWNNRDSELQKCKEWRKQNPEKVKEYNTLSRPKRREIAKNRIKVDINFRLTKYMRTRLYSAIKNNQKVGSAIRDLGCSIAELKKHLESKWQPGMNWDNYGDWEIDHVVALCRFDLANRDELLKACNYTNMQPLWKADHNSKTIEDRKYQ
jgi:hypothetical protein